MKKNDYQNVEINFHEQPSPSPPHKPRSINATPNNIITGTKQQLKQTNGSK